MEEFREFPQLETDRLILREMTLDDVEFYFRHFNKDEVVEGCCFPGPKNLEAAKKELELLYKTLQRRQRHSLGNRQKRR